MAELVDALVSDASGATRVSSNLIGRTKTKLQYGKLYILHPYKSLFR